MIRVLRGVLGRMNRTALVSAVVNQQLGFERVSTRRVDSGPWAVRSLHAYRSTDIVSVVQDLTREMKCASRYSDFFRCAAIASRISGGDMGFTNTSSNGEGVSPSVCGKPVNAKMVALAEAFPDDLID